MVYNNIFLENGYLDFDAFMNTPGVNFFIILGGRGTGKTFGSLEWCYLNSEKFVYSRKNQVQLDFIRSEEENPIQALNREKGYNLEAENARKI